MAILATIVSFALATVGFLVPTSPSSHGTRAGIMAMTSETLDSTDDVGAFPSIAIGSNDEVHISYIYDTQADLKYATKVDGTWTLNTVDSLCDAHGYTSLAVDSDENIHIAYLDVINLDLKYVTNADDTWTTTTVDSTSDVNMFISLAVDSNDKVHISYYESANDDLKYATNVDGSWVTSIIDSIDNVGGHSCIAVDSNDRIHISYCNYTDTSLKYATNATGSWVTSTIDSEGIVGYFISMAIDSNDGIHISYYDDTNNALKYASNAGGAWLCDTVDDSIGGAGMLTSLAIDSNDRAHVSYYDSWGGDLKYATNARGSWATNTVDSSDDVGRYSSIAVNSTDVIHIGYYDYTNHDLKYATVAPEPTCVIRGWVNDSVTHEGIGGATVLFISTEDFWSDSTLTDETGYYELTASQSELMVRCQMFGYYSAILDVDTTGESEYRLDIELEAEPTVPKASMSIEPDRNISENNPMTVTIAAEDFNLIGAYVLIGRIHNKTDNWVNFTLATSGDSYGDLDFDMTYEDDVLEGTAEWSAKSSNGGYLANDTSREYVIFTYTRYIGSELSHGIASHYYNDTISMEEGYAFFDEHTGEYQGFEFSNLTTMVELNPILAASPDDVDVEIAPLMAAYPWSFDSTLSFEEMIWLTPSLVPGERRSVVGLTFEQSEIVPSGEYITLFVAIDGVNNLNGTAELITVDTECPVAYAGEDLSLEPGDEATLTGVGSDNVGVVDYTWVIEDNDGTEVTVEGQVISYEFVEWGDYTVTLTVRDGANNEASDTMAVWVYDETDPTADAGDDIHVLIGEAFTLNGTGSSDNTGIIVYQWSCEELDDWEEEGGEVEMELDTEGEYTFTLETRDAGGNSDTDDVIVYVTDRTLRHSRPDA